MKTYGRQDLLSETTSIIEDITSSWDLDYAGGITGATRLVGDLTFESIEIVQLMVAIEKKFNLRIQASQDLLMEDGRYVPDLTVNRIVDFIESEIKAQ